MKIELGHIIYDLGKISIQTYEEIVRDNKFMYKDNYDDRYYFYIIGKNLYTRQIYDDGSNFKAELHKYAEQNGYVVRKYQELKPVEFDEYKKGECYV